MKEITIQKTVEERITDAMLECFESVIAFTIVKLRDNRQAITYAIDISGSTWNAKWDKFEKLNQRFPIDFLRGSGKYAEAIQVVLKPIKKV